MATRLRDVAERAGVSLATTSRVLSGDAPVSEELRRRVLASAQELDYTPNRIARSMSTQRTLSIGLVVADITSPSIPWMVRGVEDTAHRNGYSVALCNTDEDPTKERLYLSVLRESRVDGVLLVASGGDTGHVERAVEAGTNLVLLDRPIPDLPLPCVQADNLRGIYQATEYLLGLGHRRIAMMVGDLAISTAAQRLAGFEAAFAAAGAPLDPALVVPAGLTERAAHEAALRLYTDADRPTAIITWCDVTTNGLLATLRELRVRIPEDISVVGFDDQPYFALLEHPLTAVSQPIYDMGQRACELLLRLIHGETDLPSEESNLRLPTKLIIRESCRGQFPGQEVL